MNEITDLREIQQVELGILRHLDQVCRENGLHFFLSNGTLLGAVKYEGFIPWDDDIDENAPEHRLAARSWNAEQIKEVSAGTILDFIEKMPGMQVMGRRVLYRGHKPAFMVDGRLEETVSMLNKTEDVVGESTNWGSGRMDKNDKRTIHYQPIPTC